MDLDLSKIYEDGGASSGASTGATGATAGNAFGVGGLDAPSMQNITPTGSDTTSSRLRYLPGGFKKHKNKLKEMSKNKNHWTVQIAQVVEGYHVDFEGELSLLIEKQDWEEFCNECHLNCVDGKVILESKNKIYESETNLGFLVSEDTPVAIKEELAAIESTFKKLLMENKFMLFEAECNYWRSTFGALGYFKNDNALLEMSKFNDNVKSMVKLIEKEYEDDLGGLQIFHQELAEGNLNKVGFFKKSKYILSEKIYSKVGKVGLVYEICLDKAWNIVENVISDQSGVLLESSGNLNFTFNGRMVLPRQNIFGASGMRELREIVEGLEINE